MNGEFLGVRDFRRGDALKSIHWVQTARNDRLIVCERGGPQQQAVELRLSTSGCEGSLSEVRENLAWRVRITASLIDLLVSRHLPFCLVIDGHTQALPEGAASRTQAWDLLAMVPLDVATKQLHDFVQSSTNKRGASRIAIAATTADGRPLSSNLVRVDVQPPLKGIRGQSHF